MKFRDPRGFIRKKSEEYDTKRFHEEALISSDNVKILSI